MNLVYPIMFLATVGETGLATNVIDSGNKLANLGAAGILGAVCVTCLYVVFKLYKDKQLEARETIETLKSTIVENTKAISKNSDVLDEMMRNCRVQQVNRNTPTFGNGNGQKL